MNKFRLIVFQLLIAFTPNLLFAQDNNAVKFAEFPLFEEIYSHLNREISYPCLDCQFTIAKKQDGYFIVLNYSEDGKINDRKYVKVWDAATKKYIALKMNNLLNEFDEESGNGLDNSIYDDSRYDFMYVFGYPEWIIDLKNIVSNNKNITSKEYEMLARAYSEKASDFVHPNQYGNHLLETENLIEPVYEKINPNRIEQFIEHANQSLFYYDQIKKQSPDYKTIIITDLDLKIAHDQMHYYSYLLSVKEPEEALKFLNQVNYNEGYLTYARDLLNDCPQNSILITHGDTDTYPLWYIQDKLGFRKDVVVINHSLMQTDWYLTMAKARNNYSTNLSKIDYSHFMREPFIQEEMEENDELLHFNEWVILAKNSYNEVIEKRLNSRINNVPENYIYLPNTFLIVVKGIETPVNIKDYYVPMLDIATLDIVHSNSNRAICTTSPIAFSTSNLYQNCAKHGNVFELLPDPLEYYRDNESINFTENNVKNISPKTIALMKEVGMYKLISIYTDIENIDESPAIRKELFDQVNKKFPYSLLIANYPAELLASFSKLAAEIDPQLNSKFKDEYATTALEVIKNVNIESTNIKKDVLLLHEIFKIYADANWVLTANKISNFTKSEKQVLVALQKKINELSNSKRTENLIWTSDEINKLKFAMEGINLK